MGAELLVEANGNALEEKGKEKMDVIGIEGDEKEKEEKEREKEKEKGGEEDVEGNNGKEKPKITRRKSTRSLTVQKAVEREKRLRVEDEQKVLLLLYFGTIDVIKLDICSERRRNKRFGLKCESQPRRNVWKRLRSQNNIISRLLRN